jgi:hypothetical protein
VLRAGKCNGKICTLTRRWIPEWRVHNDDIKHFAGEADKLHPLQRVLSKQPPLISGSRGIRELDQGLLQPRLGVLPLHHVPPLEERAVLPKNGADHLW